MSVLLEILGRAIAVDTGELIWHWLNVVSLPAEFQDTDRYRNLSKVVDLVADNKHNAALEQLRVYLFDNPSCIYGRMAAAAMCLHRNRPAEAIDELNSVYCRQPNNTMALYALGHCYERIGVESEATAFYQDCLKFKNYLQLPAQRLAAIYFKDGKLDRTIEQYELIKEQYPDDVSALTSLGHLYILAGRNSEATDTFNQAILIHPDNFMMRDDEINELIQHGHWPEALERVEDLLSDRPDRPDLMMKRGDILAMMGATDDAVLQLEAAVNLCPDFLEATIKLGTQYLHLNKDAMAAQQFNAAVEINDRIVDAYIGLALSQKMQGDRSEALSTLSLAAAIQPNSSFLFTEVANLIFAGSLAGTYNDATSDPAAMAEAVIRAHYQQIDHQGENPDLHYRLGVLLMGLGKLQEAAGLFRAVIEINPTYARARSKLAVCLYETGEHDAALEQLAASQQIDAQTLDLHYKTALLYCDKIKFASSLLNLDRYMEDNFASSETTVNISIVLQNLGLVDRVTAMWDSLTDTANQAADINQQ